MTGICKLCLHEKELRHSHILPEFMYQNLYDQAPKRFYTLTVNLDKAEESKKKIEQKGIREYLLCGDCEVQLSKFENYAAETIYAKNLADSLHKNMNDSIFKQMCYSNKYEKYYELLKNINNQINFNESDNKEIS